jgi:hypothetical protein
MTTSQPSPLGVPACAIFFTFVACSVVQPTPAPSLAAPPDQSGQPQASLADPAPRPASQMSGWVDPAPPDGWQQCAGFVNTANNDISANFLDGCLGAQQLRVRVYNANGLLEEDVAVLQMQRVSAWPNFDYLSGQSKVNAQTHWGAPAVSVLFVTDDGTDACRSRVAQGGLTLGSGHAERAIIVGGATGYDEYRISCGGQPLPERKIAVYR